MAGQIIVKEDLQRSNRQRVGLLKEGYLSVFRFRDQAHGMGTALLFTGDLIQLREKIVHVAIRNHAINRLKIQSATLEGRQFHQSISRRMIECTVAQLCFHLFIVRLCGCQRVVSVTHCIDQIAVNVFFVFGNPADHFVQNFSADTGACDTSAAQHQFKIIQSFKRLLFSGNTAEQTIFIVNQQKHVGKLIYGRFTDGTSGRNPLQHRCLRCTNGRRASDAVVIFLQIDLTENSLPHPSVGQLALNPHHGIRIRIKICLCHMTGYFFLMKLFRIRSQIGLGQYQIECGRASLPYLRGILPIAGIRRKLITGNDSPLCPFFGR